MSTTDVEAVAQLNEARDKIYDEVGKVIVGQREVIGQMLTALLAGCWAGCWARCVAVVYAAAAFARTTALHLHLRLLPYLRPPLPSPSS